MESSIPYKRFVPASKFEPRFRCLTSSPRSLASIISAAKIFLIVLGTIFFFKTYLVAGFYDYPYSSVFILVVTNACVIVGHRTSQSWAFIPYLVVHIIYNAFAILLIGLATALVVFVTFYDHRYASTYPGVIMLAVMGFVTSLLYAIVEIWCYVIVYKAWNEVRQQNQEIEDSRKFPPPEELFV